jgi:ferric-dicitrate binding protein FerR (iron transport regulator)
VDFEVAHEPDRAFRVVARSAEVIAIGTQFDVRLGDDSTLVTVVEGRVAVGPSPMLQGRSIRSDPDHSTRFVQLIAGQQISRVFTTDDTEAFIAFLRSLQGVRVEVTATQIRVSRD